LRKKTDLYLFLMKLNRILPMFITTEQQRQIEQDGDVYEGQKLKFNDRARYATLHQDLQTATIQAGKSAIQESRMLGREKRQQGSRRKRFILF